MLGMPVKYGIHTWSVENIHSGATKPVPGLLKLTYEERLRHIGLGK